MGGGSIQTCPCGGSMWFLPCGYDTWVCADNVRHWYRPGSGRWSEPAADLLGMATIGDAVIDAAAAGAPALG